MALDADNVRVALTGAVYVAAEGSPQPANAAEALDNAYTDLGWISEEGVVESYSDDMKSIKGWQGGATVRRVISSSEASLKFTCIETSPAVVELYHKGDTVAAGKIDVHSPGPDVRTFVLDVLDGSEHLRIVVPRGEVSERGDIVYKSDEAVAYELTITAYPDDDELVLVKMSNATDWSA